MARTLPLLTGLALVVGTGFVHGLWTQRWGRSPELETAVQQLQYAPENLGPWRAESTEVDLQDLAQAGAEGYWARRFVHAESGQTILVILLCGRSGPLCVHRPEHCYRGAGYEMAAAPVHHRPSLGAASPEAEFWTARFSRPAVTGSEQLRIFWAWYSAGAWKAPESPRWTFAHQPVLYKLYVVRSITTRRPERPEQDPAAKFLERLLPALELALYNPDQ